MVKQLAKGGLILMVPDAGHMFDPQHPLAVIVVHARRFHDRPGHKAVGRLSGGFCCVWTRVHTSLTTPHTVWIKHTLKKNFWVIVHPFPILARTENKT